MRLIGSLVMLTLLAGPAYAQAPATPAPAQQPAIAPLPPDVDGWTLTPFLNVGFGGDLENSPAGFGAGLGYGFSERVALEGEIGFTPGAEQGLVGEVDSSLWTLTGNVLYHFVTRNTTPYVALGLGMIGSHTDADEVLGIEDDTEYQFAINWGAGLKTALNERFGLRADLRYFTGDDLVPNHWRLYGGLVFRRLGE